MAQIQLGVKLIDKHKDEVYIIAEIGQNHQGCIDTARKMIMEAKAAGVDCVKFQKSDLAAKFTQSALDRPYHGVNSWGQTYGDHKVHLEFTPEQYYDLQQFCSEINIDFTASAMDEISLKFLDTLNVPFIKIGSGDANNFPMITNAAKLLRPLVISTGMQTMKTVDKIVEIMRSENKSNYAFLHCVSAYPTTPTDCNLQMIKLLKNKYPNVVIGYSGHELGIEITKAAVLLGARIIERHFTLDKTQKGSDHKCSLEPNELASLVQEIGQLKRNGLLSKSEYKACEIVDLFEHNATVQAALHNVKEKCILPSELSCKEKLGKSIVAAKDLRIGHKLQADDITIKVSEPNGIPAENYDAILGAELSTNVVQDEAILFECLRL